MSVLYKHAAREKRDGVRSWASSAEEHLRAALLMLQDGEDLNLVLSQLLIAKDSIERAVKVGR